MDEQVCSRNDDAWPQPTFLHAGDGMAAYPAQLVQTWPERNKKRYTQALYAQDVLDLHRQALLRLVGLSGLDRLAQGDEAVRDVIDWVRAGMAGKPPVCEKR